MYPIDWITRRKLRTAGQPAVRELAGISPVVWALGLTSFLTDISSEMVHSVLPVYLVLHLRLSPLQYGAIDGVYNGLAIVMVTLAAGVMSDRARRHREVALAGYGLSAACKLLLLAAGASWGNLIAIVGLDRIGKGIRSAPRDALISLSSSPRLMASAFAVHRALDAGGALLGPIVAFALLARLPGAFDVVWMTSFVFALLGVAALWLYVPKSAARRSPDEQPISRRSLPILISSRRFLTLTGCAMLLSVATVSDAFIYLVLQEKGGTNAGFVPLFYVATAASYMLFSIPVGVCADRFGRARILVGGYFALALVYFVLAALPTVSVTVQVACLLLLGLYYAGTEGVLVAMVSTMVTRETRTTGIAVLATAVALGKVGSSLLFGWIWETRGVWNAIAAFGGLLMLALPAAGLCLRRIGSDYRHA
jgi:MFS family permease